MQILLATDASVEIEPPHCCPHRSAGSRLVGCLANLSHADMDHDWPLGGRTSSGRYHSLDHVAEAIHRRIQRIACASIDPHPVRADLDGAEGGGDARDARHERTRPEADSVFREFGPQVQAIHLIGWPGAWSKPLYHPAGTAGMDFLSLLADQEYWVNWLAARQSASLND